MDRETQIFAESHALIVAEPGTAVTGMVTVFEKEPDEFIAAVPRTEVVA